MLKRTVKYEDFNGETQTEVLHFNLTKAELSKIMVSRATFKDDEDPEVSVRKFSDELNEIGRSGDGKKIIEMFEWLLKEAYGEKSEDGKRFVKSEEVYENWRYSASYDQFWEDLLLGETSEMAEFINGIMPKEIAQAMKDDPEFAKHREALEKQSE